MWLLAVSLLALLYSGTAAAFECAGVTLPSTLVICSVLECVRQLVSDLVPDHS